VLDAVKALREGNRMRKEYDFEELRRAEPKYMKHLKRSLTLRLDAAVIRHFKRLAVKTDLPYQSLINFVLREYAISGLEPTGNWSKLRKGKAA
jgi:uncharacterized protein (DUF4415 family)